MPGIPHILLKFDPPIDGGATIEGHEKEIILESFSGAFSQPSTGIRASSDEGSKSLATHQPVSVSKLLDSSSIGLMKSCWTGSHFTTATLTVQRATGSDAHPEDYLTIKMEKVLIADFSVSGGPNGVPMESLSLDYAKVTYTYKPQEDSGELGGNLEAFHDLALGTVG